MGIAIFLIIIIALFSGILLTWSLEKDQEHFLNSGLNMSEMYRNHNEQIQKHNDHVFQHEIDCINMLRKCEDHEREMYRKISDDIYKMERFGTLYPNNNKNY